MRFLPKELSAIDALDAELDTMTQEIRAVLASTELDNSAREKYGTSLRAKELPYQDHLSYTNTTDSEQ